jgi:hypothetical protein
MSHPRADLPLDPPRSAPGICATTDDALDERPPALVMVSADDAALCTDDICVPLENQA